MNPALISQETGIPVICVTYEDSDGLIADISNHFPDDKARISA